MRTFIHANVPSYAQSINHEYIHKLLLHTIYDSTHVPFGFLYTYTYKISYTNMKQSVH
uniref:Uncharacterized protein n=1 Tax=Helianthus annuus TaxID=4232 RepID=A0A251VG47_HELAN